MAWCTNLIKIQFARYVQYCHVAVSSFSAEVNRLFGNAYIKRVRDCSEHDHSQQAVSLGAPEGQQSHRYDHDQTFDQPNHWKSHDNDYQKGIRSPHQPPYGPSHHRYNWDHQSPKAQADSKPGVKASPDRCGQITCTVMADSLLQGAGTRRMNGTDGKAQLSKCRSIKPSLKHFFVNLRRVDVLKAEFGLVRNKSGLWSIQVPAAGKCSESGGMMEGKTLNFGSEYWIASRSKGVRNIRSTGEADRGFRVNKGSPFSRAVCPFARTFPLVPYRLFCMSHSMARSPSLIALLFALIMVFSTVNANSLPWMKRQNSLVGTGGSSTSTTPPTSSSVVDVSTSSAAPTTSSTEPATTTSPTTTSEAPTTSTTPTTSEAPTTSQEPSSTSQTTPTSEPTTSSEAPSSSTTSAVVESTSSAAPSSSAARSSVSQTAAGSSSATSSDSSASASASASSSGASSSSGTKTSSSKSSKTTSSEIVVIGSGTAATTIDRSTVSKATTITSALVSSSTRHYTTTIVTVTGGSTLTTAVPTEEVVASTTGYATATISPSLNDNGSSGSSGGGLSTSSKKIIGGVVGGVGGAILLGGLALVAWRMWGRRRASDLCLRTLFLRSLSLCSPRFKADLPRAMRRFCTKIFCVEFKLLTLFLQIKSSGQGSFVLSLASVCHLLYILYPQFPYQHKQREEVQETMNLEGLPREKRKRKKKKKKKNKIKQNQKCPKKQLATKGSKRRHEDRIATQNSNSLEQPAPFKRITLCFDKSDLDKPVFGDRLENHVAAESLLTTITHANAYVGLFGLVVGGSSSVYGYIQRGLVGVKARKRLERHTVVLTELGHVRFLGELGGDEVVSYGNARRVAGVTGCVDIRAGAGCDSTCLGGSWLCDESGTVVKSMCRRSIMLVARLIESETVPFEFMNLFGRVYHEWMRMSSSLKRSKLVFRAPLCLAKMVEFLTLARLGLIPRRIAHQQYKEHDGAAPDIRDVGTVAKLVLAMLPLLVCVTDLDDFGSNVGWTSTDQTAHLGVSSLEVEEVCSKAKVGQLQIAVGRQQHVLRLDVSVRDAFAVTPGDGIDELLEIEVGDVLSYTFVGLDLVKQETDYVGVARHLAVQTDLELNLLGS
ncbi:kinase-like protein, partial [Aureobasidium melanogenum]